MSRRGRRRSEGRHGGSFRRLVVGQAVSAFGDWMATLALIARALDISDSGLAVGGILTLRLGPSLLAGPVATKIIVRWDRRRIMLAMDAIRAAAVIVLTLVAALWWLYVWAFVIELAGLVFLPARDATIPDLVDEEHLTTANALILGSSYATLPLGAAAFTVIAAFWNNRSVPVTTFVFLVDAVTFVVSFALIARIRALPPSPPVLPNTRPARFRDALRIPFVRVIIVPALLVAVGLGALFSLGIVFVRDVLGADDTAFGVLVVMFGVGAGIGVAVLKLIRADGLTWVRWSVIAQGALVAGMSLAPQLNVAFLGAVGFGAATAVTLTLAMSAVQTNLAGEQRTLAFTAFHVLLRGGLALAALLTGVAADLLGSISWPLVGPVAPARAVLFLSGTLVVVVAAVSPQLSHPIARSPTPERPAGDPRVSR